MSNIEVMKQAQKALENSYARLVKKCEENLCAYNGFDVDTLTQMQEAITALRQAIEQAQKQEQCLTCETLRYEIDALEAKIAELREQAQKQEPVALKPCWYESKEMRMCRKCGQVHAKAIIDNTPPPRQPLEGVIDVQPIGYHSLQLIFRSQTDIAKFKVAYGIKE